MHAASKSMFMPVKISFIFQGHPRQALQDSPESLYHAHLKFAGQEFKSLPDVVDYIYNTPNNEIEIDQDEDSDDQTCKYVTCLRVFTKSPLNGAMSGYEKAK